MIPKHKQGIQYGAYAIIASFLIALGGSYLPEFSGISLWCTMMSIVTGLGGIMIVAISLFAHFDK